MSGYTRSLEEYTKKRFLKWQSNSIAIFRATGIKQNIKRVKQNCASAKIEVVIERLTKVCKSDRNNSNKWASLFEYVLLKTQVITLYAPRHVLTTRLRLS